jgi:uncharacterized YigZ family protein
MPDLNDTYLTVKSKAEGFFKDRNSKFISHIYPVNSEEEIKYIQKTLRKTYHDARHHCFAWKLGVDDNNYRVNDDGEPNNSAGQPIYGQILSNNITNVLIVVIRYFGGTKLGIPGLINAYRNSAAEAISDATIIEKHISDIYSIDFTYEEMNLVMRLIKEYDLKMIEQNFDLNCNIKIEIRQSLTETVISKFNTIQKVKTNLLRTI